MLKKRVSYKASGFTHKEAVEVSPEAEFTPKTVETPNLRTNLVYRARIVVETPDLGLRQGAPVSVKIPLGTAGTGELGLEGKEEQ